MYESFFQLKQRPFAAAPRVDRYFPGTAIEAPRQALVRCVDGAQGAGLIVGSAGTGKTLLCHLLAEQFRGKFAVALLSNGHLDNRRELLQAILFELGLPYRRFEEGELRLSLIDYVSNEQNSRGGLLLIVDEAHTLSTRLLEEVRLIANLVRHGQPRVRLVLAGNPNLEECLADPSLEALTQRVAIRCYLQALDFEQTQNYVLAQMRTVGGDARQVFSSDALQAIYHATGGVPRLINQVCDHVLMLAYAGGQRSIGRAGIEEAWSDLQQLPALNYGVAHRKLHSQAADEQLIEFGNLDDDQPTKIHTEAHHDELFFEPAGQVGPAAEATLLIHQIDDHLNDLNRDYVASVRPLVNAFPLNSSVDPFSERFDEEEVLIDRYRSLDATLGELQQVNSDDSRAIAALLEPFDQFESPTLIDLPTLSIVGDTALSEPEPLLAMAASRSDILQQITANPLTPFSASTLDLVAPTTAIESVSVEPGEAEREERSETATILRQSDERYVSDDDLMIVEDDPRPEIRPHTLPPQAQVRRQEYRQLFSSLRRG